MLLILKCCLAAHSHNRSCVSFRLHSIRSLLPSHAYLCSASFIKTIYIEIVSIHLCVCLRFRPSRLCIHWCFGRRFREEDIEYVLYDRKHPRGRTSTTTSTTEAPQRLGHRKAELGTIRNFKLLRGSELCIPSTDLPEQVAKRSCRTHRRCFRTTSSAVCRAPSESSPTW